jgi:hypothetical protein
MHMLSISLLARKSPGETQVSKISCFDDFPLPVCVSKSAHIGKGSIVQGTENIREASFMEKPSGTPRSGIHFMASSADDLSPNPEMGTPGEIPIFR